MNPTLTSVYKIFEKIKPDQLYRSKIQISDKNLLFGDKEVSLSKYKKIHLLAMGKASAYEAQEILSIFKEANMTIHSSLVITKYGHSIIKLPCNVIEAAHPVVDKNSLIAGREALKFIDHVDEDDLLIFCLSGGASALVESYDGDLTLEQMQDINRVLLSSGIGIEDFNLIRKSVSKIKNGGLFSNLIADSISFITCDIPSGNLHSVSSAPSLYDEIDRLKLQTVLKKYLDENQRKLIEDNISLTKSNYSKGIVFKIADADYLGNLAKKYFINANESFEIFDSPLEKEKQKIIQNLEKSKTNISLGELNIKVTSNGLGGRNTHFVLTMVNEIFYKNVLSLSQDELKKVFILSVGTDGSDGPTDAAGAYFDYQNYQQVPESKVVDELSRFNSYHFFDAIGTLIKTGATGTNLMDLRIIQL